MKPHRKTPRKRSSHCFFLKHLLAAVFLCALPWNASAFFIHQPASQLFGQANFTDTPLTNQGGTPSSTTVAFPHDIFADGTYVYLWDQGNNRVLVYSTATAFTPAAVAVIGQNNFTSGSADKGGAAGLDTLDFSCVAGGGAGGGLFSDGTDLYVSDSCNHRLLIYKGIHAKIAAFIASNTPIAAEVVVGQPDEFSTGVNAGLGAASPRANTLNRPLGIFVQGGKLFIADQSNHRVLIYNTLPSTHNASADIAVGQEHLHTQVRASIGGNAAKNFDFPNDIWTDGTRMAIADGVGHRVHLFETIPSTHFVQSDKIVGQTNATNLNADQAGTVSSRGMKFPIAVDFSGGRLFIGDFHNRRVLVYNGWPTAQFNSPADIVIGKTNFTSNSGGKIDSASLDRVHGLSVKGNRLYVADHINTRAVAFLNTFGIYTSTPVSTTDQGPAELTLTGDDFPTGAQISLRRSGQTDIAGTQITFSSPTLTGLFQRATATFSLGGKLVGAWNVVVTSGSDSFTSTGALTITTFQTSQVIPNFGYRNRTVLTAIKGSAFPASPLISLTKSGEADIAGTDIVFISSSQLQARFDLSKKTVGLWNVKVSSGANSNSLAESFLVSTFPEFNLKEEAAGSIGATGGFIQIVISNNGLEGTKLIIPAGALPGSLTLNISLGAISGGLTPPPGFSHLKTPLDLAPSGVVFSSSVTLEIPYSPADLTRLGLECESCLTGRRFNTESGQWETLPVTVDTAARLVRFQTNHFSAFSIMATAATDLSGIKAFPNPFVPSEGHQDLRITGLPLGSSLSIFTYLGEEVRQLNDGGNGVAVWNGRNAAGQKVASGVYIGLVDSPLGKKKILLSVER